MTLEEELGELRTTAWHQKPEIAADATQGKIRSDWRRDYIRRRQWRWLRPKSRRYAQARYL